MWWSVLALLVPGRAAPPAAVADFELPRWPSGERVRLHDFAGQIVLLDFFASWCAPCEVASRELEAGIQRHYAARHGNPHGLQVQVLSVNVEPDQPVRTGEFVRRTRASFVVTDDSSRLLESFGQSGIPFLVVLDGTAVRPAAVPGAAPDPGAGQFRVVYRHAGFEGTRVLRRQIDLIGAAGQGSVPALTGPGVVPGSSAGEVPPRGVPVSSKAEVDSELLWASGFFLANTQLRYEGSRGGTGWDAAFTHASHDMDYQPNRGVDFFGYKTHLHEDSFSLQSALRQRVAEEWTVQGSAGWTEGYPNHRRVWIANRYRQKYDHPGFPRVPPYREPDPRQRSVSLGTRWEYRPTVAVAELNAGYSHENSAPGYEDGTNRLGGYQLMRGRENLDTASLSASSENVLSARLRLLNKLTAAKTTAREWRLGYEGSLNLAVGERWVVRATGGFARERPQFEAVFGGVTAEWEPRPGWFVSVDGRGYSDSGEIENSLPITSAAPPLDSWQVGVGVRYVWRGFSLRLHGGPVWTDYHPRPNIGPEFIHLYEDRNWGLAQMAVALQF